MTSRKRAEENSFFTKNSSGKPKRIKTDQMLESSRSSPIRSSPLSAASFYDGFTKSPTSCLQMKQSSSNGSLRILKNSGQQKICKKPKLPLVVIPMPDNLDDKIFEHFLNFIPLQNQVNLRGVSSKWNNFLSNFFLKKESLKLFTSADEIELYINGLYRGNNDNDAYFKLTAAGEKSDDLIIKPKYWNEKSFNYLKSIFPNIKHLLIYISADKTVSNQLYHLISSYFHLESLSICGKFNLVPDLPKKKIFDLLNTEMHLLKRLDLRASDVSLPEKEYKYFPGKYQLFYVSPLLLAKLEHFSLVPCFQYYIPEVIAPLGNHLKTLRLERIAFTELTLEHLNLSFMLLNPSLLNTVTDLTLSAVGSEGDQHSFEIFQFICNNFKQLERLQFYLPRNTETILSSEFLQPLTNLDNLKHLHLGFLHLKRPKGVKINQLSPPTLHSVKTLSLYFMMDKFKSDYFTKQASASFVSLESLLLKSTRTVSDKHDLLSREQLTSFPPQMEYNAYSRKSEEFEKNSRGRHPKIKKDEPETFSSAEKYY